MQRETSHSYNREAELVVSDETFGYSWGVRRIYPVQISWKMAAALSDDIFHLPSTHFQTRWLGIVGSLLEDKGRLVRLLEGPFVVLAQIRPIHSGYNIVINVVHYIEIVTSQLYLTNRFKGGK